MTFSLGNICSITVLHHPLTAATKPSKVLLFSKSHTTTTMSAARLVIPARDRLIDFGKYKGRMLGTLPSTYLKWVSSNLRARDFKEWAELADEVLEDPIYKDRLEWEFAEKVLNGNNVLSSSSSIVLADDEKKGHMRNGSPVSELLGISERFGWDNEDKLGWSKIDFQLLGTSKGGRIPRLEEEKEKSRRELPNMRGIKKEKGEGGVRFEGQRRKERRERLRLRSSGVPRQMRMHSNSSSGFRNESNRSREEDEEERIEDSRDEEIQADVYNPFPGRESLLRKVLNGGRKPFY